MELNLAEFAGKTGSKDTKLWLPLAITVIGLMLLTFEMGSYMAEISIDALRRSICENLITLAIKFLNFFIAKSVQFRYLAPLETVSSFMSLVFWVVFTRSVSSLYSSFDPRKCT